MHLKKRREDEIKVHFRELLEGTYPEEEISTIGENRGQLFVRIPNKISKRIKLKKGGKLRFKVWTEKNGENKLTIEVPQ